MKPRLGLFLFKLGFVFLILFGCMWALQPLITTLLDGVPDDGWRAVIEDILPTPLLDPELFESNYWEAAFRITILIGFGTLTWSALAYISRKLSTKSRLAPKSHENCPYHTSYYIAALAVMFLILAPTAIFIFGIRVAQERLDKQAQEERLHPAPKALTRGERNALGKFIDSSSTATVSVGEARVFAYELAATNTVCPVHSTPLRKEIVPVTFGLYSSPGTTLCEGFPYGRLAAQVGCVKPPADGIAVLRCSNCVVLNERFSRISEYYLRKERLAP